MPDIRAFLHHTFEKSGGEMSFEDFMALALYEPVFGYYTAGIRDVGGARADFATSATLTGALSHAIACWLRSEIAERGWEKPFDVIEVGAGNGALAEGIIKSLNWRERRKFRYHIVDISHLMREQQREKLDRFRVSWHGDIQNALRSCNGRAMIISNELIDAFPAKWLRWNGNDSRWDEVFVRYSEESGLGERFRPLPGNFPLSDFSATGMKDKQVGSRIEIQPSVKKWLSETTEDWREGAMLTIDYGGTTDEIYHRRPGGTMRGYYKHERIEGGQVYLRPGSQDITVDVNFTDVQHWGEELGLKTVSYETQAEFLKRFGQGKDVMATSEAGESFRVLHQRPD